MTMSEQEPEALDLDELELWADAALNQSSSERNSGNAYIDFRHKVGPGVVKALIARVRAAEKENAEVHDAYWESDATNASLSIERDELRERVAELERLQPLCTGTGPVWCSKCIPDVDGAWNGCVRLAAEALKAGQS